MNYVTSDLNILTQGQVAGGGGGGKLGGKLSPWPMAVGWLLCGGGRAGDNFIDKLKRANLLGRDLVLVPAVSG